LNEEMNKEADPKLSYRDVLQCFANREENIQTNIDSRQNSCQRTPNRSQQNIKEISRK